MRLVAAVCQLLLRVPAGLHTHFLRATTAEVLDGIPDEALREAAPHGRTVHAASGALQHSKQLIVSDLASALSEEPHGCPIQLPQRVVVEQLPDLSGYHPASNPLAVEVEG
jgi:hypothetical protein